MYTFIVNPTAGDGRAKRTFFKLKRSEFFQNLNCTVYMTEYTGHAESIAREISESRDNITCIIVIGGDGTLHEVMNGLSNNTISIAFIPGGSGNDFAKGCQIKGSPMTVFERILAGENIRSYWLGNYQLEDGTTRRFVNSIGFGFDAEIAQVANQSFCKRVFNFFGLGSLSYVVALIQVVFCFKPKSIDLEINGKRRHIAKCWMVTLANHAYYGGGMKIIPHAKIQETKFPVLLVHSISKWKMLAIFLTVFTGKHVKIKEVEVIEASQLKISTQIPLPFQVDGQTGTSKSCVVTKQNRPFSILGSSKTVKNDQEAQINR